MTGAVGSSVPVAGRAGALRSLGILGAGTILAAVLGLLFQSLLSYFFGAGAETDAYFMSVSIFAFLAKFLMLGHLKSIALPLYAQRAREDPAVARRLAGGLLWRTAVLLALLSVVLLAGAPVLVWLMAPGFSPEIRDLTVLLVRIRVPGLLFLGVTTVGLVVLESAGRFGVTVSAQKVLPAAVSLVLLLAVADRAGIVGVGWIGLGASAAGAVLVVVAAGSRFGQRPERGSDPDLRAIGGAWIRFSGSNAATFLAEWVFRVAASLLPVGLFSAVLYGRMVHDLLHGAVNDAAQTVVLPHLARVAASADARGSAVGEELRRSLRALATASLPLALLVALSAEWIVALLFGRGRFLEDGMVGPASVALSLFAVGFFVQGLNQIGFSAAFASGLASLVNRVQILGHVTRAAILLPLVWAYSYAGLVLAQVVMNVLVGLMLTFTSPRDWGLRVFALRLGFLRGVAGRVLVASLAPAVLAHVALTMAGDPLEMGLLGRSAIVAGVGIGWAVVYVALAAALGVPEVRALLKRLRGMAGAVGLAILLSSPGAARAQSTSWVPLESGHWAYRWLELLEARGRVPVGVSASRPLPAARVERLLVAQGSRDAHGEAAEGGAAPRRLREEFAIRTWAPRGRLTAGGAGSGGTLAERAGGAFAELAGHWGHPAASGLFGFLGAATRPGARAELLRGGIGARAGPIWIQVGRERHQVGGGAGGGIVLSDGAYLDGVIAQTAVPQSLPVVGAVEAAVGLFPLGRYEAVEDPWFALARVAVRPRDWLQLSLGRGVLFGGTFAGGSVPYDPVVYGPDEGGAGVEAAARAILGLPTRYDDHVVALGARGSLAPVGLPVLAYMEFGLEDAARSWGDPALIAGALLALDTNWPLSLRYEYAAFGEGARVCPWCDTLPAFWYQHVRFQSGYRVDHQPLGHPLGGYGVQHMMTMSAWSPGLGARVDVAASFRRRDRWNLFEDERPGEAWALQIESSYRWRGGVEVGAIGRVERGRQGWSDRWGKLAVSVLF